MVAVTWGVLCGPLAYQWVRAGERRFRVPRSMPGTAVDTNDAVAHLLLISARRHLSHEAA